MREKPALFTFPLNPPFNDLKHKNLFNLYQAKLAAHYSKEDALGVLESSMNVPAALRDIYVPLRLGVQECSEIDTERLEKVEGLEVPEVIQRSKFIAISGIAGSGKSILTKFLSSALGAQEDKIAHQIGRRLVLPFVLREFDMRQVTSMEALLRLFAEKMSKDLALDGLTSSFFEYYIKKGWAILIFDGFDEIGEKANKGLIDSIRSYFSNLSFEELNTPNTVIITGRPSGFLSHVNYDLFEKYHLLPFNQTQIDTFAENFFSTQYGAGEKKQKNKENFLARLAEFKGLDELKHRPIYLAMLVFIWETDGELPYTRTVAYSKMINAYLHQLEMKKKAVAHQENLDAPTWTVEDKRVILEELAYLIHTSADQENQETEESTFHITVTEEKLFDYFKRILSSPEITLNSIDPEKVTAKDLLKFYLARTGLLIEPAEGHIQFSHLSFQEYLVASRIYRRQKKRNNEAYLRTEIFSKLPRPGWQEVAQHFYGIDNSLQGDGQSEQLQFLFDNKEPSHYLFLMSLFAHSARRFSEEEMKQWLNSMLVFLVSSRLKIREIELIADFFTGTLKRELEKQFGEPFYSTLIHHYTQFLQSLINEQPSFPQGLLAPVEEDKEDCGYRLKDLIAQEQLYPALFLGNFLLRSEKEAYLKLDLSPLKRISGSFELSVILNGYTNLFPEQTALPLLRGIIDQNLRLVEKTCLLGTAFFDGASVDLDNLLYKKLLERSFSNYFFLYNFLTPALGSGDRELFQKVRFQISESMAMARDRAMAMAMARARDRDRDRAMAMARDMNMNMNMARARARDMARDMDIDMVRDMAMARDMDMEARGHLSDSWICFNLYASSYLLSKDLGLSLPQSLADFPDDLTSYENLLEDLESSLARGLTDQEKEELQEWCEKSDFLPLVKLLKKQKLTFMSPEQVLLDFHQRVKDFNEATKGSTKRKKVTKP